MTMGVSTEPKASVPRLAWAMNSWGRIVSVRLASTQRPGVPVRSAEPTPLMTEKEPERGVRWT